MEDLMITGDVIPPYKHYEEYKKAMDTEIEHEVEGFVRIGYLLKLARDTHILDESGYRDIYEFAENEYKKDRSQVSRYMAINDMFSKDGYSMELEQQYKGYGYSKLVIMKDLPEELLEELTPDFSKSEIQTIKDEITEESKTTELEVMMEDVPEEKKELTLFEQVLTKLCEDKFMAEQMYKARESVKGMIDVLAPSGEAMHSQRVEGIGRVMLSCKQDRVSITPLRHPEEKEYFEWEDVLQFAETIDFTKCAEVLEEQPEEPKPVAPVQQEKKKPKKVIPAKVEEKPIEQQEEQLKGQICISNFPEYMPDVENTEINTECTGISRQEYEEKKRIYLQSYANNIGCADVSVNAEDWTQAKKDLKDAQRYLELLEELDEMEVEE